MSLLYNSNLLFSDHFRMKFTNCICFVNNIESLFHSKTARCYPPTTTQSCTQHGIIVIVIILFTCKKKKKEEETSKKEKKPPIAIKHKWINVLDEN